MEQGILAPLEGQSATRTMPTDSKRHRLNEWDNNFHASPALRHDHVSTGSFDSTELPAKFSWKETGGSSYVTKMLNQHLPQYCGSCFAHGTLSALADRVKIARAAMGDSAGPEINLAVQHILNCGKSLAGTCHGGHPAGVYQFVLNNDGVVYDSCLVYEAKDEHGCSAVNICRDCFAFGYCWGVSEDSYALDPDNQEFSTDGIPRVRISEHGHVSGEHAMMKEIMLKGPIACGVNADAILDYKSGVVMAADWGKQVDHVVSIVGWGEEDGVKYWEVRNQWGEYWGEKGWFRVERGVDALGIEDYCYWATPESWGYHNTDDGQDLQAGSENVVKYDEEKVMAFHRVVRGLDLQHSSKTPPSALMIEGSSLSEQQQQQEAPPSFLGSLRTGAAILLVSFFAFFVGRKQGRKSALSEERIPLTTDSGAPTTAKALLF